MSPRPTIADTSGFTLLEMLVAIAILSLATVGVGMAFPQFQQRAELRQAANKLDSLLARAREEALSERRPSEVRFRARDRQLELPSKAIVYRMPKSVSFAVLGAAGGLNPEEPRIVFLSDGSSTGGVVELRSGGLKVVRRIGWLTGRIEKVSP
ncbi:GspH/FimT family pseudopilin [Methylopila sp. M107]|uniref:GspH/FimT family pseudopilin n=1 Tax=Methylopila sp. M107 TaxID=1101190 RepID=UPI00036CB1EA|nr:GspH/FimT family pseudopilin [Methylopila sp. M107]